MYDVRCTMYDGWSNNRLDFARVSALQPPLWACCLSLKDSLSTAWGLTEWAHIAAKERAPSQRHKVSAMLLGVGVVGGISKFTMHCFDVAPQRQEFRLCARAAGGLSEHFARRRCLHPPAAAFWRDSRRRFNYNSGGSFLCSCTWTSPVWLLKGVVHSKLKVHPFTTQSDVDGGSSDLFKVSQGERIPACCVQRFQQTTEETHNTASPHCSCVMQSSLTQNGYANTAKISACGLLSGITLAWIVR